MRHSEATAQATRERGLLVHELEEKVSSAPKWYEVRAGSAQAEGLAPRTASSVADDLQAVAQEVVERITVAEAAEAGKRFPHERQDPHDRRRHAPTRRE